MKNVIIILCAILFAQCNTVEKENVSTTDSTQVSETTVTGSTDTAYTPPVTEQPATTNHTGCYLMVSGRDSIILNIIDQNGKISGTLRFKNYQKDSSRGTVKGEVKNGQIHLIYDFLSEGTNSLMEVVFKPVGEGVVRGTGEMDNKKDSTYFTNPSQLNFNTKDLLLHKNCSDIKQ